MTTPTLTPTQTAEAARRELERVDNLIYSYRMYLVTAGEDPAMSVYLNKLYLRADRAVVRLHDAQRRMTLDVTSI